VSLIDIVTGAPWWVWGILVFLVDIGIRSMHQRSIYIPKLFLIPIIMIGLKYKDIFATGASLSISMLFLCIGSMIGIFFSRKSPVVINKAECTVQIPGSYLTFAFLMSFFCIKFIFGYFKVSSPEDAQSYLLLDMAISSLFSGYFLGRALYFTSKFFKKKS
jgi:hypothetical protein